jgi:2-methylisocitrate lyase-like PEP mutase family enzyme
MANAAQKVRRMLEDDTMHLAPGVFDGMTARLAAKAGFEIIYASGGAIARSCGFPDIGLISFTEVLTRLQHMCEVVDTPIIADADTGYGNSINVDRTVRAFERIGVAAIHLEDQTFPKRCGHLDDKSLISIEEMAHKIRVAKRAQMSDAFVLIARTDAIAVEGFDAAIERSLAYAEAGADVLFVEAPETVEQIERIAELLPQPKLINMFHGGKTPIVDRSRLAELGYKFVIIPSDLQRAAIKACQNVLRALKETGDSSAIAHELASFSERETIIGTESYLAIDGTF